MRPSFSVCVPNLALESPSRRYCAPKLSPSAHDSLFYLIDRELLIDEWMDGCINATPHAYDIASYFSLLTNLFNPMALECTNKALINFEVDFYANF